MNHHTSSSIGSTQRCDPTQQIQRDVDSTNDTDRRLIYLCDRGRAGIIQNLREMLPSAGMELQGFAHPLKANIYADEVKSVNIGTDGCPPMVAHGPYAGISPGHPEPLIREVSRFRIREFIDRASALGVHRFVLHMNFEPETCRFEKWSQRHAQLWRNMLGDLSPDMIILLENTLENDPEQFADALDMIDDRRIQACLDIGHIHCTRGEGGIREWFSRLGQRIAHIHMHDNYGPGTGPFHQRDRHLTIGEGTVDWIAVRDLKMEYAPHAALSLEIPFEGMLNSIAFLRQNSII